MIQREVPETANRRVAIVCATVAAGMVGMAYASVPLYRLFCQVTGFGGTTQVAEAAPVTVLDRTMTVKFDANVGPGLTFRFVPAQRDETLKIGEQGMAYYEVTNTGTTTQVGTAVFNVVPHQAGIYFNKIECFCFTEQKLEPGQSARLPVVYFVDPAIADDPDLKTLPELTLSYTFYPAKVQATQNEKAGAASKTN
ncbi:MAG: cytochrome c oxidase assembly protein [Hyphomicrobiales bacterium]